VDEEAATSRASAAVRARGALRRQSSLHSLPRSLEHLHRLVKQDLDLPTPRLPPKLRPTPIRARPLLSPLEGPAAILARPVGPVRRRLNGPGHVWGRVLRGRHGLGAASPLGGVRIVLRNGPPTGARRAPDHGKRTERPGTGDAISRSSERPLGWQPKSLGRGPPQGFRVLSGLAR